MGITKSPFQITTAFYFLFPQSEGTKVHHFRIQSPFLSVSTFFIPLLAYVWRLKKDIHSFNHPRHLTSPSSLTKPIGYGFSIPTLFTLSHIGTHPHTRHIHVHLYPSSPQASHPSLSEKSIITIWWWSLAEVQHFPKTSITLFLILLSLQPLTKPPN